jgi:acetyl esterase
MRKSFFGFAFLLTASAFAAGQPTKEMQTILDAIKNKNGKQIEQLSAVEARLQPTTADAVKVVIAKKQPIQEAKLAQVKILTIQGAAGKLSARLYRPEGKGLLPVVVYYHGGEWVRGDVDDSEATPRSLAVKAKAIFVSVEYRKGPENKFPAAHDDAFAAYQWVLKNAKSLGGDPKRIAVAGEDSGGNLALNVAIMARDKSLQKPIHELLIYPVASGNMNTVSYKENVESVPLNKGMMNWSMDRYLRSDKDKTDLRIDLLRANFRGLAPATIITAEIDPLKIEGLELSEKMQSQGVDVTYRNYEGVTHDFFGMAPVLKEAQEAQGEAVQNLTKSFNR